MEKSSLHKDVSAAECILLCKNIQSDDMNVKSQSHKSTTDTSTQSKVTEWMVCIGECCGGVERSDEWRCCRVETGECWYLVMGWDGMAARHGGCPSWRQHT